MSDREWPPDDYAEGRASRNAEVMELTEENERLRERLLYISSFKHMIDGCDCVSCKLAEIARLALQTGGSQ